MTMLSRCISAMGHIKGPVLNQGMLLCVFAVHQQKSLGPVTVPFRCISGMNRYRFVTAMTLLLCISCES